MARRRRKTTEIAALHEDDVLSLIQDAGLHGAYQDLSLCCSICQRPLREAGAGAVRSRDGALAFACTRLDCVQEMA